MMTLASSSSFSGRPLAHVVADLGMLSFIGMPPESVWVREVVMHDPLHRPEITKDDIVLGVGMDPSAPDFIDFCRAYASAGASALAVKGAVDHAQGGYPLQLLRVSEATEWARLATLLDSALDVTAGGRIGNSRAGAAESLFALCEVLASTMGGPVVIHDAHWRMLAYASGGYDIDDIGRRTILSRRAPEAWLEEVRAMGGMDQLALGEVFHIGEGGPNPTLHARVLVPIHAGGERLGVLCVIHPASRIRREVEELVTDAADLAALHLIRSRIVTSAAGRAQSEVLANLIAGETATPEHARVLRVPYEGHFLLALLKAESPSDLELAVTNERLIAMVGAVCEAYRLRSLVCTVDGSVFVLLQVGAKDARSAVIEVFASLHNRARTNGLRLRSALGSSFERLDLLRSSLETATTLLALQERGVIVPRDIADHTEHAILVEYEQVRSAMAASASTGSTALQLPADLEQDEALMSTLITYFDLGSDIQKAARVLGVHPNTVRYRIRRLNQLFSIDLTDPTQRFLLELKVRLWAQNRTSKDLRVG